MPDPLAPDAAPVSALASAARAIPPLEPVRVRAKFFFEGDRKFFIKGVTYGPFRPDAEGNYLGTSEQLERDLRLMAELGVTLLRIYHTPPVWFLDRCAAANIRVLITIPWS